MKKTPAPGALRAAWKTPLGRLDAEITARGVRSLDVKRGEKTGAPGPGGITRIETKNEAGADAAALRHLAALEKYLTNYFAGKKPGPLPALDETNRTEFERRVWAAARGIDRGGTLNYGALAAVLGAPKAARAAGGALGRNPLLLLTPCHRIVPAGAAAPWDEVGGFASGPDAKRWLLRFESGL